jgi:spore germination protein YaaH
MMLLWLMLRVDRRVLTYEVGVFDTLNSIALKFGMNSAEVMRLNKLRSSNVYSGQVRAFQYLQNSWRARNDTQRSVPL